MRIHRVSPTPAFPPGALRRAAPGPPPWGGRVSRPPLVPGAAIRSSKPRFPELPLALLRRLAVAGESVHAARQALPADQRGSVPASVLLPPAVPRPPPPERMEPDHGEQDQQERDQEQRRVRADHAEKRSGVGWGLELHRPAMLRDAAAIREWCRVRESVFRKWPHFRDIPTPPTETDL